MRHADAASGKRLAQFRGESSDKGLRTLTAAINERASAAKTKLRFGAYDVQNLFTSLGRELVKAR
jgi:hypothetical protein